jgi:hypothetical protein
MVNQSLVNRPIFYNISPLRLPRQAKMEVIAAVENFHHHVHLCKFVHTFCGKL